MVCFSNSQICNNQSNSLWSHNQWHISLQVHLLAQFIKWECWDVCMHTAKLGFNHNYSCHRSQINCIITEPYITANHFILITKQGLLINQSVSYVCSQQELFNHSVNILCLFTARALQSLSQRFILCLFATRALIIMYIYHALVNTRSAHMIHTNLNMIFYTHVEHSPTKTIYIKYYTKTNKKHYKRIHTHRL